MADSVSVAVLKQVAIGVARSMGIERVAEFWPYRDLAGRDVLLRLEEGEFAPGTAFLASGRGVCEELAASFRRRRSISERIARRS